MYEEEGKLMKTTVPKRVTVAAGAAAATAVLTAGAGLAQAQTHVETTTDAAGVTVHITSWAFPPGPAASNGDCTYTAVPVKVPPGVLPPLPVYNLPFHLQEGGTHDIWFPGIQTGTKWAVTVHCPNGIDSPTMTKIY